jgi:hypothetical protein
MSLVDTTLNGLTLTQKVKYSPVGQLSVANSIQLFTRTPSGTYDFSSPVATVPLQAVGSIKQAIVNYTLPENGYYYLTALALSSNNVQSDPANSSEILIDATTEELPAASNITISMGVS